MSKRVTDKEEFVEVEVEPIEPTSTRGGELFIRSPGTLSLRETLSTTRELFEERIESILKEQGL